MAVAVAPPILGRSRRRHVGSRSGRPYDGQTRPFVHAFDWRVNIRGVGSRATKTGARHVVVGSTPRAGTVGPRNPTRVSLPVIDGRRRGSRRACRRVVRRGANDRASTTSGHPHPRERVGRRSVPVDGAVPHLTVGNFGFVRTVRSLSRDPGPRPSSGQGSEPPRHRVRRSIPARRPLERQGEGHTDRTIRPTPGDSPLAGVAASVF